jgi:hypothetical protein
MMKASIMNLSQSEFVITVAMMKQTAGAMKMNKTFQSKQNALSVAWTRMTLPTRKHDVMHVFIPSRGRYDGARKLTEAWRQEGFNVHWVVEPKEALDYDYEVEGDKVHPLPIPNAGIGYSRNYCVNLAASFGYESIILADDDIKPGKNANMDWLLEDAEDPKVLGITARYSYHDLCLGSVIRGRSDLILLPIGTFRLVALNVNNVLDIGNYDHTLIGLEDNDLFMRGLQAGYPWMIHLGTWSISTGTRYQPGGMSDFMESHGIPKEGPPPWYQVMADQYPDFVSGHKKNRIRFAWQQAYNRYLPEWRKWSWLHGGDIENYFNDE